MAPFLPDTLAGLALFAEHGQITGIGAPDRVTGEAEAVPAGSDRGLGARVRRETIS